MKSRKELVWLLLILNVLNALDTASTFLIVQKIGWAYEGNPFLRWLFTSIGEIPAVTVKMVGPIVMMAGLWLTCEEAAKVWHPKVRWFPWLLLCVYAVVPAFNLVGVLVLR